MEEGWNLFQEKKKKEEKAKERKRLKEAERMKILNRHKPKPLHPYYYEGSPYIEEEKKEDKLLMILNAIKSPTGSPFRKEFFKVNCLLLFLYLIQR